MPDSQFECRFSLLSDDGDLYNFDVMKLNLKPGQQYLVSFDLETLSSDFGLVNSNSASIRDNQPAIRNGKQELRVMDIVKKMKKENL